MMVMMGQYALAGALLVAVAVMLAVVAFWRLENAGALRAARWGMAVIGLLLTVSAGALLRALLTDDFSVAYVVEHSERALPVGYKIAAFWAAQGGGLLLWAWAMGVMGAIMAIRLRKKEDMDAGVSLAVLAAITGFFVAVIMFAGNAESPSNPLDLAPMRALDGQGLNPALQSLAMVFHPPMLFLGYAGFAAPFALLMGALVAGSRDGAWLKDARAWMLWSWVTLTVGIILGCWWAYTELGWGGYWAWDPVENASLLPWLTGTALLHAAVLQARRGVFKRWTAVLTVLSFLLCIFGTYITRSGIKSVHSFAASDIPLFFLVLMGTIVLAGTGLILARLDRMEAEHPLEDIVSREGFFLLGCVLLVAMAVVTAAGTALPLLAGMFTEAPIEAKGRFYNTVILPMALLLAALMATGPVLGHGTGAGDRAKRSLLAMAVVGLIAAVISAATGHAALWAMGSMAVVAAVLTGVVIDFSKAMLARIGLERENVAAAHVKVISGGLRHWGAQVAHLGLAAIVAGVAGSSLYQTEEKFTDLAIDKPQTQNGTTLTLHELREQTRDTYKAWVADVDVTDAAGKQYTLHPEIHFYNRKPEEPAKKVDAALSLRRDVYVRLLGTDDSGKLWAVQVILNPLVNWIWIGGALLTLGGLLCMVPQRRPVAVRDASEGIAGPAIIENKVGRAAVAGKGQMR